MFCEKCGSQNQNDSKFCFNCGNPLVSAPVVQAQPVAQNQPVPLKLYMPSKFALVTYKFEIKDSQGYTKFTAKSGAEGFTGYRMTMYDMTGQEIVLVKQKHQATFTAVNFEAYILGQFVTDFMQKASFTKYYYEMPQLGMKVDGDFINHKFRVLAADGTELACIARKMMSWGDDYEISIADSRNELLVLAAVFAVEMMVITLRKRRRR